MVAEAAQLWPVKSQLPARQPDKGPAQYRAAQEGAYQGQFPIFEQGTESAGINEHKSPYRH